MKNALIVSILAMTGLVGSAQGVVTIQGILLKSDGKPRQYTEIELVPLSANVIINDSRLLSASDVKGRFWFDDVPPGQYTLSINFDDKPTELSPYDTFFYPLAFERDDAEIISIDKTTRLRNIVFRLPQALVAKTLTGRVLLEDGTPSKEAMIGFWDLRIDSSALGVGSARTDAAGRFKVVGFVGRKYELAAMAFDHIPQDPWDRHESNLLGVGRTGSFVIQENGPAEFDIRVKLPRPNENFWKKYFEG